MYLDITDLFSEIAPCDYAASASELGPDAGRITWEHATEDAPCWMHLLDTDEKRQTFREYIDGLGAWSDDEIWGWSDRELVALLLQIIAGDMRTFYDLAAGSWETWGELEREGNGDGRLFGGSLSVDGRVYYNIGY